MWSNYEITQGVTKTPSLRRNENMFIPWKKENKLLTVFLKCPPLRKHLLSSNLTPKNILIVRKNLNDQRDHEFASNFRKMSKRGSLYLVYFLSDILIFIHKDTIDSSKRYLNIGKELKKFQTFFSFVYFFLEWTNPHSLSQEASCSPSLHWIKTTVARLKAKLILNKR